MALIVDTGPLYAAADQSDRWHRASAVLLSESSERLVTPAPVLVEVSWLMGKRLGAEAFDHVLANVEDGAIEIEDLTTEDYARVRQLRRRYADLPLGFVDAAIVAVAERLREGKLASLDRRHFGVVRPRHVRSFTLLPAR